MAGGTCLTITICHFLFPQNPPSPLNRQVAVGATEGLWGGYSSVCLKGTTWAPVAGTQAGGGSSVPTLLCAKNQADGNCEQRSDIWQIFQQ